MENVEQLEKSNERDDWLEGWASFKVMGERCFQIVKR